MIYILFNEFGVFQSEFAARSRARDKLSEQQTELAKGSPFGDEARRLDAADKDVVKTSFKWCWLGARELSISYSVSFDMHIFKGKLDMDSVIRELVEAVRRQGIRREFGASTRWTPRTRMDYLIRFALAAKEASAPTACVIALPLVRYAFRFTSGQGAC
jgi:hypothetical protein